MITNLDAVDFGSVARPFESQPQVSTLDTNILSSCVPSMTKKMTKKNLGNKFSVNFSIRIIIVIVWFQNL